MDCLDHMAAHALGALSGRGIALDARPRSIASDGLGWRRRTLARLWRPPTAHGTIARCRKHRPSRATPREVEPETARYRRATLGNSLNAPRSRPVARPHRLDAARAASSKGSQRPASLAMGIRRRVLAILLASRRLRWPGAKSEPLALPLRVRPAFIAITAVVMVLLALLGFHPTLASKTRVNDKVLSRCVPPAALAPSQRPGG